MELLIIEEQGLIEKINISWICNELHVEQQACYKLVPRPHTHTHTFMRTNAHDTMFEQLTLQHAQSCSCGPCVQHSEMTDLASSGSGLQTITEDISQERMAEQRTNN